MYYIYKYFVKGMTVKSTSNYVQTLPDPFTSKSFSLFDIENVKNNGVYIKEPKNKE